MEKLEDAKKIKKVYIFLNAIRVFGTSLFIATDVMFLIEHGLNLFEISLVAFMAVVVVFFFEIPTGAIADVYGRKISFVYSCFIVSLGLLVYAISDTLLVFAIASSIVAIGFTLESGAFSAWLVDNLKHYSSSSLLSNTLIRDYQVRTVFAIIGILCGSFIASINTTLPWILASLITAITGIMAIFLMKEEYFKKQKLSFSKNIQTVKKTIKTSITCIKNSDVVRFLFLLGLVQSFAIQASATQWQPYFSQLFQGDIALGYLRSGMLITTIAGITLSSRVFVKNNYAKDKNKILIRLQVVIGLGIFLSGLIGYLPITIVSFLSIAFAVGIFGIIEEVYINENIPSSERATILSFMSVVVKVGMKVQRPKFQFHNFH